MAYVANGNVKYQGSMMTLSRSHYPTDLFQLTFSTKGRLWIHWTSRLSYEGATHWPTDRSIHQPTEHLTLFLHSLLLPLSRFLTNAQERLESNLPFIFFFGILIYDFLRHFAHFECKGRKRTKVRKNLRNPVFNPFFLGSELLGERRLWWPRIWWR